MKLLELGKFYPPHLGGIETLLRSFFEGFAAKGMEVDCVVANDSRATCHEVLNGVRVHRFGSFGLIASTSVAPGYLSSTRRYGSELWHHHFPNPLADAACLAGRRDIPLVVTYHSNVVRQAVLMKWYGMIVDRLLWRATAIVVSSPQLLASSERLQRHRHKCRVIPFGIRLEAFGREERLEEAERARAEAGGRPVLLTVGRLVGYKGHRVLIEAAKDVDVTVWIVGCGPLERELKEQAAGLGIEGRVRFFGAVSDALLAGLLKACDLFVLPSVSPNEAFGLVQVEAMACGKAVISCRLESGVPFVNQDGVTGFVVTPGDAGALATAIRKLAGDRELRVAMGRAGKERAHKEFAEEQMLARYSACFEECKRAG